MWKFAYEVNFSLWRTGIEKGRVATGKGR